MKLKDVIILEQPGNKENETFKKAPQEDIRGEQSTSQVAKQLGVTPSRVRQMKMDGEFKTVKGPVEGRRDNMISTTEVKNKKEEREHRRKSKDDKKDEE